jgi:hypothetical protein
METVKLFRFPDLSLLLNSLPLLEDMSEDQLRCFKLNLHGRPR